MPPKKDASGERKPIRVLPWKDGINPYIEPERRASILATRKARSAEIKQWYKDHPEAERFPLPYGTVGDTGPDDPP